MDLDVQRKLRKYVEQCSSQAKAAKKIGLSEAVISTYLKGTYRGNVEKVEEKLKEVFSTLEAAESLESTGIKSYVPTSISESVYDTINLCHLKGGLAIECGDAGIGKTMACKKYAEDYPNTSVYISVNPCFASIVAFLKLLCNALNLSTAGRKDDMWLRIVNRLKGERKVLIIDEAQHLPIKTIESIRAMFDIYPEIGVCLVGNIETYTNTGKSKDAFAQIKNRTKFTEIRETKQIQASDIRLLFPKLQDEKSVEFMLKIARSAQGIRGTQNIYSNAVDNENITYNGLATMAKSMKVLLTA